jgi:hypothetical protein
MWIVTAMIGEAIAGETATVTETRGVIDTAGANGASTVTITKVVSGRA